jgi:hypothetical protein
MAGLTRSALSRRITLKINSERYIDRDVAARRIQQAQESFGLADGQLEANPSDPGWTLSEAQLPSAIEFAFDDDKFPKQEVGPSSLSFGYEFCWIEFDGAAASAEKAESRRIQSTLGVIIGERRLFLQPHFVYPAMWTSERLKDFVGRSELIAPFRFRDQCFKRWLPPRNSQDYGRLLRLEASWRRSPALH